jgi:hypothetical protein
MQGLSYREYVNLTKRLTVPEIKLEELLEDHVTIAREINSKLKPLEHFTNYLKSGYYPFFQEIPELYYNRVEEVINLILEIELPLLRKVDVGYIPKLKQLLQIIAESVPFIPNVSKLSERIGINRNTFISYLYFLQEANITRNLYKDAKGITQMQKPDKIYLENSNLQYVFSPFHANTGNVRETFFVNQLSYKHLVEYAPEGDFLVDHTFTFELGGKTKTNRQIKNTPKSFIIADDLEYGMENRIPLWMFGFLY